MSPFVVAPQMKKLPLSSQNVRDRRGPDEAVAERRQEGVLARRGGRRVVLDRAVGREPDVGGPVAEEQRDEREHDHERDHRDPADGQRQPARGVTQASSRQEHELPGGVRRGQDPGREPASRDEPAVGDHGGERDRHGAGGDARSRRPRAARTATPRSSRSVASAPAATTATATTTQRAGRTGRRARPRRARRGRRASG